MDTKSQIEIFHLLFLEQLGLKLDKRLYALKGGCNLRFFFNSIRYSEDIDFDVHTVAITTLEKIVSKILHSTAFKQNLLVKSISIVNFSTPKQTITTQRWKVTISNNNLARINTKIEFSRRQNCTNSVLEPTSKNINVNYNLRPIYISHYPANIALQQKILALALRTETQARDIFDITLLLQKGANVNSIDFTADELDAALKNANSISFADFKSQVISYLENDYIEQYSDPDIWDNILITVIDYIGILIENHKRI